MDVENGVYLRFITATNTDGRTELFRISNLRAGWVGKYAPVTKSDSKRYDRNADDA